MGNLPSRICSVLLLCLAIQPVHAISNLLYEDLKQARSEVFLTKQEYQESMGKSLAVLIGCELDPLCTMIAMKHMSTNEDNLLYIHFYNKLLLQRNDILFNAMQCQSPELNQTRKVMASCLNSLQNRIVNASDMEAQLKADTTVNNCTRSRLSKFARANNNVFAQAKMMEYELGRANTQGIEFWYNKMQVMMPLRQYHVYTQCSHRF